MTERDDPTARAAAYAVNADSDLEHAETEALRAGDPALDAEIAEFAETAALLGLAVPPVTPSASLRDSVLAAVDADIAATAATPAGTAPSDEPALEPAMGKVTPIRPWTRRPATLITAIAAVGALLFGGTAVAIGIASQGTEQVSAVDEVLLAQDAQRITADVDGGGTATWVWSASLERSVVIVDDLPELATGSTYQLWYIDDAGAMPAGTFTGGSREIAVDGTMPSGSTHGVTVEPEGGSTTPTTDPILLIASA